jgi:hypothetical protein
LNFHAFLGVFRFAQMPVRRTQAISPRGKSGALYLFKKAMLRRAGRNLPMRLQ